MTQTNDLVKNILTVQLFQICFWVNYGLGGFVRLGIASLCKWSVRFSTAVLTIFFTSFSYPPSSSSKLVIFGSGCCRFQFNILLYLQTLRSVGVFLIFQSISPHICLRQSLFCSIFGPCYCFHHLMHQQGITTAHAGAKISFLGKKVIW